MPAGTQLLFSVKKRWEGKEGDLGGWGCLANSMSGLHNDEAHYSYEEDPKYVWNCFCLYALILKLVTRHTHTPSQSEGSCYHIDT